jgi:hypothetical protein
MTVPALLSINLTIDSKLRGYDVVNIRIGDLVVGGRIATTRSSCSRRPAGRFSSS